MCSVEIRMMRDVTGASMLTAMNESSAFSR